MFADSKTEEERLRENPEALISEIFENFITNFQSVTASARGKFKIHMPDKPCKWGPRSLVKNLAKQLPSEELKRRLTNTRLRRGA
ncbi:hypothetical protein NPIL_170691, partial [Nephila pilipes]